VEDLPGACLKIRVIDVGPDTGLLGFGRLT
jgi:hypothetical protein